MIITYSSSKGKHLQPAWDDAVCSCMLMRLFIVPERHWCRVRHGASVTSSEVTPETLNSVNHCGWWGFLTRFGGVWFRFDLHTSCRLQMCKKEFGMKPNVQEDLTKSWTKRIYLLLIKMDVITFGGVCLHLAARTIACTRPEEKIHVHHKFHTSVRRIKVQPETRQII